MTWYAVLACVLGGILVVLYIVAWCKIFKKAGIHPLKFLIPGYGYYLSYKLADSAGLFFYQMSIGATFGALGALVTATGTTTSGIAMFLIGGLTIVISSFIFNYCLASVFGKGRGFTVGLCLLNPIFICILGFGNAEYQTEEKKAISIGSWQCPACGKDVPFYKGTCTCGAGKKPAALSALQAQES